MQDGEPTRRVSIPAQLRATALLASLSAALASVPAPSRAGGAPQDFYVKKSTWHETMIASREAKARSEGTKPADAPVPLPDLGTDPFTIAAWIRTRKSGAIVAKAPARGQWVAQGKVFLVFRGRPAFDIGWVGCVTAGRRVDDGEWHHVAVAGKDGGLRLYVDGRLDKEGSLAGDRDVRGHVLKIGRGASNFPRPSGLEGDIDEVRLYGRDLSADEVKALHERPGPGDARAKRGLVAHWPFEGDGRDSTGGRNHASEMTGASFVDGKVGKALHLDGKGGVVVPVAGDAGGGAAHDLWMLVRRDFFDAASRREMTWEREDGIWRLDWRPGDFAELARRYAAASHRSSRIAAPAKALAERAKDRAGLADVRRLYLLSRQGGAGAARGVGTYYIEPGDVVLFIGDALFTPAGADGGLVDFLRGDLRKKYPGLAGVKARPVRFVNAGVAGDTAGDGLRRVRALVNEHKPTVAVVCFGTNGLFRERARVAADVASIARELKAASVAVTLLTPPCLEAKGRPELAPYADVQAKMVEELKDVARRETVLLADCHAPGRKRVGPGGTGRSGGDEITWGDGVHPNDAGRRIMADALQAAWGFGKPRVGE